MAAIGKKKRRKLAGTELVSLILLTMVVVLIIIPFWNAIVISLQTEAAHARQAFSWWPEEITLENYRHLFISGGKLLKAYRATIILAILGTVCPMIVTTMAAYGFSRSFPGKRFFMMMMLATMFISGGLIPTYLNIKQLGLLDTYSVIVLSSLVSTYNIIVMKSGFESVPMELQEAAMIDGATDLKIFTTVMLPLQKPIIATFSLFNAVGMWNSWYTPMLYLNSGQKTTLQLYLRSIINNATVMQNSMSSTQMGLDNVFSDGIKMAAVFVVMLPIMLIYPFIQKYFVKGLMVGAVKM